MDLERVSPALRQRLGPEGSAGLVKFFDAAGEDWTDRAIEIVADRFERRVIEETSKVRVEVANGLSAVRHEMALGLAGVRQEMAEGLAAVRQDMAKGHADLRNAIADQKFEILKWTFVFWTGQFFVTASFIVMLLRALRPG